jgi:hypothetical protein
VTAPPKDPDPDQVAKELLADDQFLTDLAEEVRSQYDQMRKDLRKLLRIPADHKVTDAELISRIGIGYIAAEALLREYVSVQDKEGAA